MVDADGTDVAESAGPSGPLPTFERRGVGLVALVVVAIEMSVASRYGWHRDELYFLEAGRHLAWGFVDQPPFTPFVAWLADRVAPGNLAVLRTLPALAVAGTVVVAALIARELGATRSSQVAAAAAIGAGGFLLGVGHLLSTAAFDLLAWTTLLWLFARLLRTGDARLWLAFGAVAGLSMLNKNLLVLLGAAILAGLVIERRWTLLATPWLAAGAAVAAAIALPTLLWQLDHGWPQLDMARALSDRIGAENRITLLPLQVLFVGPAFVFVLWQGARSLARSDALAAFRPLLWAWPVGVVAALVTGGRPYYVLPLTTVILLAGIASHRRGRDLRWLILANAAVSIPLALPVAPASWASTTVTVNEAVAETIGWPELVDQVGVVVAALPDDEGASVVLLTGSYGEAGAIDRFGHTNDLPTVYSPHNGYADFRQPTDDDATVVAIRFDCDDLQRWFDSCQQVATVETPDDVANEIRGESILVLRGLRGTWAQVWEEMRFLS